MGFEDLNPEAQAKARVAKTLEELGELADECGQELSDENLEAIDGGVLPHCQEFCPNHNRCPTATGMDGKRCPSYVFR